MKKTALITGSLLAGLAVSLPTTDAEAASLLEFDVLGSGNHIRVELMDAQTPVANKFVEYNCGEGQKTKENEDPKNKDKKNKKDKKDKKKKKKAKEHKCGGNC